MLVEKGKNIGVGKHKPIRASKVAAAALPTSRIQIACIDRLK
jgi:hypothetical protein